MVTKKKARPGAGKSQAKRSEVRLSNPRWELWKQKDGLSLKEAALLSMGIQPIVGIVGFLHRERRRRAREYRTRINALTSAYGKHPQLPSRASLPRLISLRGALEFSSESGWSLLPNVQKQLDELRRSSAAGGRPSEEGADSIAASQTPIAVAQPSASLTLPGAHTNPITIVAAEMQGRASRNVLKTVGALVVLIEQLEIKKFQLGNGKINHSALSIALRKIAEEHSLETNVFADFSDRLVKQHLSDGRSRYRPYKSSNSNANDGSESEASDGGD